MYMTMFVLQATYDCSQDSSLLSPTPRHSLSKQVNGGVHRLAIHRRGRFAPLPRPHRRTRLGLVAQPEWCTDIVVELIWAEEIFTLVAVPTPALRPCVADPSVGPSDEEERSDVQEGARRRKPFPTAGARKQVVQVGCLHRAVGHAARPVERIAG